MSLFFTISSWAIGILVLVHAAAFLKKPYKPVYMLTALLSLLCATGAFMTDDFIVFLVFWGSLLVLLYVMLAFDSFKSASKAFVIIGLGDFSLLLGVALLIARSATTSMSYIEHLPTTSIFNSFAFILIALGAVIKAGVIGFHDWIIDAAGDTQATTMAFLPASLDKFLGIYLLVRACRDFFAVDNRLLVIVMALGAVTILFAVLMALIQHNLKKLLAFHAVSQVGYMVLGIASGTILGLAGGIFHMLNNTIYKTTLFLSAGNIEYATGETELDRMGGLNKIMPATFFATAVASLSIAGVPPFNGFVSKWMIYQGLIPDLISKAGICKILFLIVAMFGSALTLASFVKVVYCAFLSDMPKALKEKNIPSTPLFMQLPIIILSVMCILLGVFARQLIISPFIEPMLGANVVPAGVWRADAAVGFIICGILLGILIYVAGKVPYRTTSQFMGGEEIAYNRAQGTDFYLTVQNDKAFKGFYAAGEKGRLNFYRSAISLINVSSYIFYYCIDRALNGVTNGIGKSVFMVSAFLKWLHSGLLDRYVAWILLGVALLMGVMIRCICFMR